MTSKEIEELKGLAASEGLYDDRHPTKRTQLLGKVIKALERQSKWVPVSERLPEDKTRVLTTIKVPGRQANVRSGWYQDGLFMNDNGDTWKSTAKEVLAWQRLPEPYKESVEE